MISGDRGSGRTSRASRSLPLHAGWLVALLFQWISPGALAVSVGERAGDNSVTAQLEAFDVHEDFEISLFADESMGIANPMAMHWDHRGRLWVLTTLTYAQLEPGERADDTLMILEDTDEDGVADRSIVFADGLEMPMGFALGHGGVFLGEGADLLFLKDVDGDDQADSREVLLTGFGTGDTHQNISNFTWGPDGRLYFSQGLHCYSRVETPWGIVRGDEAGFFRFDPVSLRLEPFCFPGLASQNPCGIVFDPTGAMFLKSNNRELIYVTPGLIPTTRQKNLVPIASLGATPGKSMGGEYVASSHLPAWLQDHILIAGYYANKVTAFPLVKEGAGYAEVEPVEVLSSSHGSFRPVEIRIGPDGAIYIADWFNPIIGHYQASLRHPDRDEEHGRIWRVTAKDAAHSNVTIHDFVTRKVPFGLIGHEDAYIRNSVRRWFYNEIAAGTVSKADFLTMVGYAPKSESEQELERIQDFELIGLLSALDGGSAGFATPGRSAKRENLAWAARMIGTLGSCDSEALVLLKTAIEDEDPRVRLEAVVACGNLRDSRGLPIALLALDASRDRFIDYALEQTVHALAEAWVPALEMGQLELSDPTHLAYALKTLGGEAGLRLARNQLEDGTLPGELEKALVLVMAEGGSAEDLKQILELHGDDVEVLQAMGRGWDYRSIRPAVGIEARLEALIRSKDDAVALTAIELAGKWKENGVGTTLNSRYEDRSAHSKIRGEAALALARIKGGAVSERLIEAFPAVDKGIQTYLVESLCLVAPIRSARLVAPLFGEDGYEEMTQALLEPFLGRKGLTDLLAVELEKQTLSVEVAQRLASSLSRAGRSDEALLAVLQEAMGVSAGARAYSPELVNALVEEVETHGDPKAGREVYTRAELTCVACHQIESAGGAMGPSLDAVGAGLTTDLLVESVLWPQRQLKEGYFAVSVGTKDGVLLSGYKEKEEDGVVYLKNAATGQVSTIPRVEISRTEQVGSLMPPGLTNGLSREELRDLIAYLASLKG